MDFATFEKIAYDNNSEEGVIARFYDRAVKTDELSADGLPKFKLKCFCQIRIKDNNSEIFDQPADSDKIKRFPLEYERYKQSKKKETEGTPLEYFAFLDAAEIASLKLRGILTVEELADLNDERTESLLLEKERELARKFVERAKGNLNLAEWQKKENDYIQKIKILESKIEALQQRRSSNEKYIRNLSRRG